MLVVIVIGLFLTAALVASDHFAHAIQRTLDGWAPSLRR